MSSNRVQKSLTTPVGDAAGLTVSFTKILLMPIHLVVQVLYYCLVLLKWMFIFNFCHIIIWNLLFLPMFIVWQPLELGGFRYPTLGAPPPENIKAEQWSFPNATRNIMQDLYSSVHEFASIFKATPPSTELQPWTGPIESPGLPKMGKHRGYLTQPAYEETQPFRPTLLLQRIKGWFDRQPKSNHAPKPSCPEYSNIDYDEYTFQELVAMSLEPNDDDDKWYYTFAKMQGRRKPSRHPSWLWDCLLLLMNHLVFYHFLPMLDYIPHCIACLAAHSLGGVDAWVVMVSVMLAHTIKWYSPYVISLIQEEWKAINDETYEGRTARAKHIYCGMTWRRRVQHAQVQAGRFGRRPLHGIETSSVRKQLEVLEVLADLDALRDLPYTSYIRGNYVFAYLLALELKTRSPPPPIIDSAKRSMLISSCGALLKELSKEKRFEGKLDLFNDPVMKFKLITQAVAIYSIPTLEEVEQVEAMQHPVNVELRSAFAALANGRE